MTQFKFNAEVAVGLCGVRACNVMRVKVFK